MSETRTVQISQTPYERAIHRAGTEAILDSLPGYVSKDSIIWSEVQFELEGEEDERLQMIYIRPANLYTFLVMNSIVVSPDSVRDKKNYEQYWFDDGKASLGPPGTPMNVSVQNSPKKNNRGRSYRDIVKHGSRFSAHVVVRNQLGIALTMLSVGRRTIRTYESQFVQNDIKQLPT